MKRMNFIFRFSIRQRCAMLAYNLETNQTFEQNVLYGRLNRTKKKLLFKAAHQ